MLTTEKQYQAMQSVAIVGAGQMGTGIAYVCALAGCDVLVTDVDAALLATTKTTVAAAMDRQIRKERLDQIEKEAALERIRTTSLLSFPEADLVVEAATEDEQIKRGIYAALCPTLKSSALLCTNTSSISVTRLGAATDRPGKFMGLHFMNPVPVMPLVELIRGIATDEATFNAIQAFTERRLGKITVSAEDFPAFIVNRIVIPMINEAIYTLYEGVGTVTAIDAALRLGAGHRMGPLELADFIGLDMCLTVMSTLHDGLSDTKYRPCPLLVKYVEAGWLGRKAGRGFYDYSGVDPVPTR